MARDSRLRVILDAEDNSSRVVRKAQGNFAKFANFLRTRFVVTLGDVENAVRRLFAAISDATALQSATNVVRNSLRAQGVEYDAYIKKLKEVSDGTLSTADIIRTSSAAHTRGIEAGQIAELLDIARGRAIAFGKTTEEAFNRITEAVAKQERELLDELGILVSVEDATRKFAEAQGLVREELTESQRQLAFYNAVVEAGTGATEGLKASQDELQLALQQTGAVLENARDLANKFAVSLGAGLAAVLTGTAVTASVLAEGVVKLGRGFLFLKGATVGLTDDQKDLVTRLKELDDSLDKSQQALVDQAANLIKVAAANAAAALGFGKTNESAEKAAAALLKVKNAAVTAAPELEELVDTEERLVEVNLALRDSYNAAASGLRGFVSEATRAAETGGGGGGRPGSVASGFSLLATEAGVGPALTREQQAARTRFVSGSFRFGGNFVESLIRQGRTSSLIGIEVDREGLAVITRLDGSRLIIPGNQGGRSGSLSLGNQAL
jgi:hypothetical protein